MDLKVYVFDDSAPQEGATEKRGYAKAVAVQVKSAPPVKVVDVLVAVLDQLDFSFETATAVFALWCTSPLLGRHWARLVTKIYHCSTEQ